MKKKLVILLLIICSFVLFKGSVLAKQWECPYKFENGEKYIYKIDNEAGTMSITNAKESYRSFLNTFTYNYSIVSATDEIKSYEDNYCPILFLVYQEFSTNTCGSDTVICSYSYTYTYTTYTDSYIREKRPNECVEQRDSFCLSKFLGGLGFSSTTSYFQGYLDKSDPNSKDKTTGSTCPSWNILEKEIKDEYKNYKECENNSCSIHIGNANSKIKDLKQVCKQMLSYRDVYIHNGEEQIQDACIETCLNLEKKIKKIKEDAGISVKDDEIICGFSGRLITYIANIVKWLKYIIPVIVIVLGILDFIKAIASEKDDEMKKAQGHFVKRLIAAALIFIIPFIIEFVLNKMGFDANGCGIIDL